MPISTNEIDIQGEYALYLRFKIPRFVTASKYNGILVLEGNQDKLEVPFSIKFFNVCLPENIDFHLVNWWDFQLETYGCELFDDHYWDTVVKIATLARYAHQNYIYLNWILFSCKKDGENLADKIIQMCVTDEMTGVYDETNFEQTYTKLLEEVNLM